MKKGILLFIVLATTMVGLKAFADVQADADAGFWSGLLAYGKSLFDATPLVGKITGGIVLIISTMKVSFIKPLWDKLGEKQEWLAPALGLLGGIAAMVGQGKFDFSLLLTAIAGGALAPYLHDLLDYLKKIPGLGKVWLTIIDVIQLVLFAPKDSTPSL